MVDENIKPREEKGPDEEPEVLTKPLPIILEEMERGFTPLSNCDTKGRIHNYTFLIREA